MSALRLSTLWHTIFRIISAKQMFISNRYTVHSPSSRLYIVWLKAREPLILSPFFFLLTNSIIIYSNINVSSHPIMSITFSIQVHATPVARISTPPRYPISGWSTHRRWFAWRPLVGGVLQTLIMWKSLKIAPEYFVN